MPLWFKHMPDIQLKAKDGTENAVAKHADLFIALLDQPGWKESLKIRRRANVIADRVEASAPGRWIAMDDEDGPRMTAALEALLKANTQAPRHFVAQQEPHFEAIEKPVSGSGPPEPFLKEE